MTACHPGLWFHHTKCLSERNDLSSFSKSINVGCKGKFGRRTKSSENYVLIEETCPRAGFLAAINRNKNENCGGVGGPVVSICLNHLII